MLPVRYLYEDYALAHAALAAWPHDADTLEDALTRFRISSNAIYPFYAGGALHFVRITPAGERRRQDQLGELSFLEYLHAHGYPAARAVPSRNGAPLETLTHHGERYRCCVMRGVPGTRLDRLPPAEALMTRYGRALGRLHSLSARYPADGSKSTYETVLRWIRHCLLRYGAPADALAALDSVEADLGRLKRGSDVYGLIHYDFEPDNVFFDAQDDQLHAIDFDDSHYHFFAMDVIRSLASIEEEYAPEQAVEARSWFLGGYRTAYPLDDAALACPAFGRYAALYSYARLLHALAGPVDAHEPDWLQQLRTRCDAMLASLQAQLVGRTA